jgi:hypothetical protein
MKVVCAWCGKVLKEGALADDMELNLGLVPMDVKPKSNVNGTDGLFLVKLTKEQMSAEPKKRQQKETA